MNADESELRAALAKRMKEERVRLGLTPEALGGLTEVHRSTVFNYEAGQRVPDALFLARAWSKAGVDVQYVVTGQRQRLTAISTAEREHLDRLTAIPSKMREVVEGVLLLAWLAADTRRAYHADELAADDRYAPKAPAEPLVLHEPAPTARRQRKPGHD
jgi:transcriptional regulator with XRE-family HTH domain